MEIWTRQIPPQENVLISWLVRIAHALQYSQKAGKQKLKALSQAGHHIQMAWDLVWRPCTNALSPYMFHNLTNIPCADDISSQHSYTHIKGWVGDCKGSLGYGSTGVAAPFTQNRESPPSLYNLSRRPHWRRVVWLACILFRGLNRQIHISFMRHSSQTVLVR